MSKLQDIYTKLEAKTESQLLDLWNEYNDDINGYQTIYTSLEQIAEVFDGEDLLTFASRVHFGNLSWNDNYFTLNAYGQINSFLFFNDKKNPFDMDELAEWLADKEEE